MQAMVCVTQILIVQYATATAFLIIHFHAEDSNKNSMIKIVVPSILTAVIDANALGFQLLGHGFSYC